MSSVTRQLFAHQGRVGVVVAAGHIGHDAFKGVQLGGFAPGFGTRLQHIAELDRFLARAKQHHLTHRFGQVFERGFQIETIVLGQALQHGEVIGIALVPAFDRAALQTQAGEGHDTCRVKKRLLAQTFASRTSTQRRVERKQARLKLTNGVVAMRAGKTGVEGVLHAAVHVQHHRAAIGQTQSGLKAFGQAGGHVGTHFQAVHHHIDVVFFFFLQGGEIGQFNHLPVDAKPHKTLRLHLRKNFGEFALALARHGGKQHEAGLGRHGQNSIHHLRHAG